MTKNNNRLNVFFFVLTLFSATLVLLSFVNYPIIVSEILISFRVAVSIAFLCFVVIFIMARAYWLGMIQILLVIVNIWPVVSVYSFNEAPSTCIYDEQQKPFKILSFNVYYKNKNYEHIYQALKTSAVDVIVLQEAQPGFMKYAHDRLVSTYPFYYPAIEKGHHARWTIYSKYPVLDVHARKVRGGRGAVLRVEIEVDGRIVNIITLHAISPRTLNRVEARNAHLDGLAAVVREIMKDNQHVIVAGDFNNVPWHPAMKAFKARVGLRNNDVAFSYFGTWPTWLPSIFSTPIDHIFYDQSFHHVSYFRKPSAGSDHYPISADLYFCE
ncbi:MAG: hypothetical protein COA45_11990 [Zetaproteobacteria bacterium]|nr:MAG: hypothetical protein COA45_11990 [Zetaproteobacteria bacterium]